MIGVLSRQFMSINIDDDLNVGVAPHLWTPSVEEQIFSGLAPDGAILAETMAAAVAS